MNSQKQTIDKSTVKVILVKAIKTVNTVKIIEKNTKKEITDKVTSLFVIL